MRMPEITASILTSDYSVGYSIIINQIESKIHILKWVGLK